MSTGIKRQRRCHPNSKADTDPHRQEARAKLGAGLHKASVALLQRSLVVLKWMEAHPASDEALVHDATVALRAVGELHVEVGHTHTVHLF